MKWGQGAWPHSFTQGCVCRRAFLHLPLHSTPPQCLGSGLQLRALIPQPVMASAELALEAT